MTPEQAKMMLDMQCCDVQAESVTTRKVLAAIPEDQLTYKPGEKAMNALDLAWHIAVTEVWFLNGIANGEFSMDEGKRPETINSIAAVLAFYDQELTPALDRVKGIDGEAAAKTLNFFNAFNLPAVAYLGFLVKHSVHHRGQMSAYLRGMGARVPSIYGGSADEPFTMPEPEAAAAMA